MVFGGEKAGVCGQNFALILRVVFFKCAFGYSQCVKGVSPACVKY